LAVFRSDGLSLLRYGTALWLLCQCSSHTTPPDEPARAGSPTSGGNAAAGSSSASGGGPRAGSGGAPAVAGEGSAGGGSASVGEAGAENSAGDGSGGVAPSPFMLGADISSVQEAQADGATFVDTDGKAKELLEILKNHGFNYVRLRAFVEPLALYGYANPNGQAQFRKAEAYCDTAHTLEVAREVKRAGMGFLLDLHYSDNWADPGKQVIPEAWRDAATIGELAGYVHDYTENVIQTLVDGGARPDMVQIGNEITPGLLIHVPSDDPQADQWGNMNKLTNAVNGSTASFANVATLLKAGVEGVKGVDPTIKTMLHVENTKSFPAVRDWVNQVRSRGVKLDVLGLSCYTSYQGQPAIWQDTFQQLADNLADISFVIAEYNPERTRANEIMRDLPDGRGLGTFFWEPTQSGSWGSALFSIVGTTYRANATDFAEFDALKPSLGL
jgi:arabinogalactan endo-1,4-beta-galactosidase